MTIWDELWVKYIQRIGVESKENIEKWAKQVKAEGDKLKEKAEKLEAVKKYVDRELDRIVMTGEYPLGGADYLLALSEVTG